MKKKKCDCKGLSLLLLRLVVVFVFLWHGIPKAFNWGLAMEKFVNMGFWGWLGPVVGIVEVIAAVLILIGLWNKWANYVLAVVIAVAVIKVHIMKGVTAGLERDLMLIVGMLVLAMHGGGLYSIEKQ